MGPKPKPKPSKPKDDKPPTPPPMLGVEFIYEDTHLKSRTVKLYKKGNSDTVDIGWKLFDPNAKTMSEKHGRLHFEKSKAYISDLGSKKGTWVQSKRGSLVKEVKHELKEGDRIVFGAKEDKGISEDPQALRVKVKFIRESTPKSPKSPPVNKSDSNTLTVKEKSTKSRAPTPEMTLKPPPENNHRRTRSLESASKPPEIIPSDNRKSQYKIPSTTLETQIKIPWADTFRLGFGINALTGDFIPRTALRPGWKSRKSSNSGRSQMVVKRLQWREVGELQDDFELEVGGTVNVLCPVGANVRVASILTENASKSTLLIQCKVYHDFEPEWIPDSVELKEGLEKLSDKEFRETYGDYYIAGCQKAYVCRMIVVCRVNEETVTSSHETEAKAFVENAFKGGMKFTDMEKTSSTFSLLNVVIDAHGCSVDPNKVFSVTEAKDQLDNLIAKATGAPRIALLYHYSTLQSSQLSPRLNVRLDMFKKAHTMRGMYAYLKACLLHPALAKFPGDVRKIQSTLTKFESQRKELVPILYDEQRTKTSLKKIDTLTQDLVTSKEKADSVMHRFTLISLVKEMNKDIVQCSFAENDHDMYRWTCGMTGGKKKAALKEYSLVLLESAGYKAYELEWWSPWTSGTGALRVILGSRSQETLSFLTKSSADCIRLPPIPNSPTNAAKLQKVGRKSLADTPQDPSAFTFCLGNHEPVLILGWSLSCFNWPSRKPDPVIEADHPHNFILSDHLNLLIDNLERARWHCKVTFVIKSSHNFPDLLQD